MKYHVKAFSPDNKTDFFNFHSRVGGECFCTAWWMRTWQEYMDANPEQTRRYREELLAQGEYDGYLIYDQEKVVGWCQVGRRDRLAKVLEQFDLAIDPKAWAITCFQIDPDYHHQGLASRLLESVLDELRQKGVDRVEAYPKIDVQLPAHEQWTGPRRLYEQAGFSKLRENNTRAIYQINL